MRNSINKAILAFKDEKIKCTSKQFGLILEVVNKTKIKDSLIWICFDVNSNIGYVTSSKESSFLVNTLKEWKAILKSDFQFTSGIFIGIEKEKFSNLTEENFDKFKTEDIEGLHINESFIEIRAFDTSYFEVYSKDLDTLSKLELL